MQETQRRVDGGDVVVIGVDPHKRSVTLEARDTREVLQATGTLPTTTVGYRAMVQSADRSRTAQARTGNAVSSRANPS